MTARRRSVYSGRVQGVGFRYTTQHVAHGFDVTGYVRNLSDGTVEVIAEGTVTELDGFISRLNEQMSGYFVDVKTTTTGATGEFSDFGVRY